MEQLNIIIKSILVWELVVIVALILLRKPIQSVVNRLISSDDGKAKIGPIEIQLGKLAEESKEAVDSLNRINQLITKSRLLELKITNDKLSASFSDKEKSELQAIIDGLEKEISA